MYLLPTEDLNYIKCSLGNGVEKLRNKRILLTGATGFIGKSLLESLLWLDGIENLNLEILSISRNPEIFFRNYPHFLSHSKFKLFAGDICDDLSGLGLGFIDLTIHAATDVVGHADPLLLMKSCINGTENILKVAKESGCQKFLLLSSGAVYGRQPSHIAHLSEAFIAGLHLANSESAYPLGKQVAEWLAQQFNGDQMEVKIARCFAFVGPYLPLDKHFAIGNFIKSAILGHDIQILGDGTPLRTYLYTSDLCFQLLKILIDAEAGSIWNVGGGEAVTIKRLAEIVCEELNANINIKVHTPPAEFIEKYVPDLTKIRSQLCVTSPIELREAINKTAEWNLKYGNLK